VSKKKFDSFQDLQKKRRGWVDANEENDFEDGIKNLLTELYPDNAHFIFELLQNAEDARIKLNPKSKGAEKVCFLLKEDSLTFQHNGEGLFTLDNIVGITGIGSSPTKSDDPTAIGKFGVGFKAVFAYTNTPEIHSGDFHFRICDLVVPVTEGVKQSLANPEETRFIFPFDNPTKKTATTAVQEISEGLRAIGDNTLLFLSHIRKIDYELPDGALGSLERINHPNGHVEIHTIHPYEDATVSHWLHFYKDVEVTDDTKLKSCRIAIAYQLKQDIDKTKKKLPWKIVSADGGGKVCIYFPATEENSNLRFHLHAPFASTVARDVVRKEGNVKANLELRDHIAELVADSLSVIRDQGLLNRSFLDVVPNNNDTIPEFYQPIRDEIWTALRSEPLIPTHTGSFDAGEKLYHAIDNNLKKLLNGSDLACFENRIGEVLNWCVDVPEALRSRIGVKTINTAYFISKLINPPFILSNWLELKENVWMQQFYSYLQPYGSQLKNTSLVRLNNGLHVLASEAYFTSDGFDDANFPTVCASTYESGDNEEQDELKKACEFLKDIGVLEITESDKIKLILEKWEIKKPSDEEYLINLNRFINYLKQGGKKYIFNGEIIFWGDSIEGKTFWCNAQQLFIDSPVRETGILSWFVDEKGYYLLSKKYIKYPSINVDDLFDFAKDLGAKVSSEVTRQDISNILWKWKWNEKPNDKEYIKYLSEFILFHNDYDLFKDSQIFWGESKNGSIKWVKAQELFIDIPLKDTGISTWYAGKSNLYPLSSKYLDQLPDLHSLVDFAIKLGAKNKLPIIKTYASYQCEWNKYYYNSCIYPTKEKVDSDWVIADNLTLNNNELEQWLQNLSEPKAQAIWNTMCHPDTKSDVLIALYKRLQRPLDKANKRDSSLVFILRSAVWVPQIESGVTTFVIPAKALQDLLPESFKYNDSNGWLKAIEFGKEEKLRAIEQRQREEQESIEYKTKIETAKSSGFDSPEEMVTAASIVQMLKIQGRSLVDFEISLRKVSSIELPNQFVNKDKWVERRNKVLENSADVPDKENVQRERGIQVGISKVKAEAKAYLRPKYNNDNHELICQSCQKVMPFKLNEYYYFEAVQCIKDSDKQYYQNYLALCPTCAAMYKHACQTEDNVIRNLIVEHDAQLDSPSVEIDVILAGEPRKLRFVGTHWFDLKTIFDHSRV
jgi:hypothetical protein